MDTLKLTKLLLVLFVLSSCRDTNEYYYNRYEAINLRFCDIRKTTINSAHISIFKKNTNFKVLEKQDSIFSAEKFVQSSDSTNLENHFININFVNIDTLPTNKDYILIINNKDTYKISSIDTTTVKKKRGTLMTRIVRNYIKSFIVNGKKIDAKNLNIPCHLKQ